MGPLIMLYCLNILRSKFCSRFTLLLELKGPNSWDSKIGDFCEETVLPMCDFLPGCVKYLTHCLLQQPLALCTGGGRQNVTLVQHYLSLRQAARSLGEQCDAESRDSLPRGACPECWLNK